MSNLHNAHPAGRYLSDVLNPKREAVARFAFDSAEADNEALFDSAESHELSEVAKNAAATVQQWAETDDLDEGEGLGDRLFALILGQADADFDGEIGDDEAGVFEVVANSVGDYLASKGVSEDDIVALLGDWDNGIAARVQELVIERLPDGEDASSEDIDSFAFGEVEALDAVYKRKIAIRHGKKVWIQKRISGTVRLSAKQKVAIRKAGRKANSAVAKMRRMRSMKLSRRIK